MNIIIRASSSGMGTYGGGVRALFIIRPGRRVRRGGPPQWLPSASKAGVGFADGSVLHPFIHQRLSCACVLRVFLLMTTLLRMFSFRNQ